MISSLDVVLPVFNEEVALPPSVDMLHRFLDQHCRVTKWRIVIADNASTDCTRVVAEALSGEYENVLYCFHPQRGRGGALRAAWSGSSAEVVGYMDVDLSTNLNALPISLAGLAYGFDIAVGSRLMLGARTERRWKREVLSRGYNLLVRLLHGRYVSDAQCGFKFLRRSVAMELLPLVRNNNWFFDTELLLKGANRRYRILEVPVEWVEDLDSRVRVVQTVVEDVAGLLRVRLERLLGANV